MTKSPPSQEQRCSACGGKFTFATSGKKKKIQCPRCRAIVSTTDPPARRQIEAEGNEPVRAAEWEGQCALLCARIERLERQVELLFHAATENPPELRAAAAPRSASTADGCCAEEKRDERVTLSSPAAEPERPRNGLAMSGRSRKSNGATALDEIVLQMMCDEGDKSRVVDVLTSILMDVGWKIRHGCHREHPAGNSPGLTLTASPALCRQRLSQTFSALSAAGFPLTLHLDPKLHPGETALLIGRNVQHRSEEAGESESQRIAEVA